MCEQGLRTKIGFDSYWLDLGSQSCAQNTPSLYLGSSPRVLSWNQSGHPSSWSSDFHLQTADTDILVRWNKYSGISAVPSNTHFQLLDWPHPDPDQNPDSHSWLCNVVFTAACTRVCDNRVEWLQKYNAKHAQMHAHVRQGSGIWTRLQAGWSRMHTCISEVENKPTVSLEWAWFQARTIEANLVIPQHQKIGNSKESAVKQMIRIWRGWL